MMSRSAERCSGPTAFISAAWTRWPCAVSAACSVRAKPQVEPPSLPTRMTVSADSTGALPAQLRLLAPRRRSQIRKPVLAERRRGRGREPERERERPGAASGVQRVGPLADPLDRRCRREGERRARRRIDEGLALERAQAERGRRGRSGPGRSSCLRSATSIAARAARLRIGAAGPPLAATAGGSGFRHRNDAEGGGGEIGRGQRRQQEAGERQPAEFAVPAPRRVAADGLEQRRARRRGCARASRSR